MDLQLNVSAPIRLIMMLLFFLARNQLFYHVSSETLTNDICNIWQHVP